MENTWMRRFYIDDLDMNAQVYINLESDISKDNYFTIIPCTEKDIEGMCKQELFRFFDENPRLHLAHKVLKEMVIYWTLDIINNNLVKDTDIKVYKWINDEEYEETNESKEFFKWGDITSVSIYKSKYSIKDILIEQSPKPLGNSYCITGDTHGDLDFKIFYEARKAGYSNIFICGDFGYIWDGSHKEQKRLDYLSNIGMNIYFIDGNHENFDLLEKYPIVDLNGGKARKIRDNIYQLMRGEIFTFENSKIFTFGGAHSTDKGLRKEGVSWWSQEVPTSAEREYALKNLEKHNNQVDYILTHTTHTRALKDMSGNYRIDDVSDFLSEIFHNVDFKHWYFGHMHVNHTYNEGKSTCIYKKILNFDV